MRTHYIVISVFIFGFGVGGKKGGASLFPRFIHHRRSCIRGKRRSYELHGAVSSNFEDLIFFSVLKSMLLHESFFFFTGCSRLTQH